MKSDEKPFFHQISSDFIRFFFLKNTYFFLKYQFMKEKLPFPKAFHQQNNPKGISNLRIPLSKACPPKKKQKIIPEQSQISRLLFSRLDSQKKKNIISKQSQISRLTFSRLAS